MESFAGQKQKKKANELTPQDSIRPTGIDGSSREAEYARRLMLIGIALENSGKKQEQYRAWQDFFLDDNLNKLQNQENPFYDIHVYCKRPFGKYNGLFFGWAQGCLLPIFLQFKLNNIHHFPVVTRTIRAVCGTVYVNV